MHFPAPCTGPLIIYHGNCPDGFAAALAAWLHFEGRGEYIPMTHAQDVPNLTGRDVYMLDIAFSRAKMIQAFQEADKLTVLDHHQSAADDLNGIDCGCGHLHFNMNQSGARMAWEYFHPGKNLPTLIKHVEDRDLLRWMHADTAPYLASLDVGPYHFHRWAGIMGMPEKNFNEFMLRGQAMHAQAIKLARQLALESRPMTILGTTGLIANAPNTMHSAVGEELLLECSSFAAMWCLEEEGTRIKVGLRGAPGFNTIPLAQAFGGGGHPYASAFRLPLERLGDLVSGILVPTHTKLTSKPRKHNSPLNDMLT